MGRVFLSYVAICPIKQKHDDNGWSIEEEVPQDISSSKNEHTFNINGAVIPDVY